VCDLSGGGAHIDRQRILAPLVKDRHRSREFIEFLKLLDAAYPAHTAIKLILDNHSAHISKETRAWIAQRPAHRFGFTFTPTHGSWLDLIEHRHQITVLTPECRSGAASRRPKLKVAPVWDRGEAVDRCEAGSASSPNRVSLLCFETLDFALVHFIFCDAYL
jgi:hypothetical protein